MFLISLKKNFSPKILSGIFFPLFIKFLFSSEMTSTKRPFRQRNTNVVDFQLYHHLANDSQARKFVILMEFERDRNSIRSYCCTERKRGSETDSGKYSCV